VELLSEALCVTLMTWHW